MFLGNISLGQAVTKLLFIIYPCLVPIKLYSYTFRQLHSLHWREKFRVKHQLHLCLQPSQIRFSCLPMSRVECMLKLPSLDLVFSSNRGELETPTGAHPTDGSHPPSSTPPGQHIPKPPPSKGLQSTTGGIITLSCVRNKTFAVEIIA